MARPGFFNRTLAAFGLQRRSEPTGDPLRRYRDGDSRWLPWNAGVGAVSPLLRERSRRAVASDGILANGVAAWRSALVGAGFTATSQHPNDAIRRTIDAGFIAYALQCDADGRTDLAGITASVVDGLVRDGESFIHIMPDGRNRMLDPVQLDYSDGTSILDGIEFNADGERVAYHPRPLDPVTGELGQPVRVDAADICHVFRRDFPGQQRGRPWTASILASADELGQAEFSYLTALKVSAMHAAIATNENDMSATFPFDGNQQGNVMESGLEPGTLKVLPGGWKIAFSTPQQVQQAGTFMTHQLRRVAAGLGVPEYLLSGDLSQANYSSLRAARIEFLARVEQIQFSILVPQFLRPIWNRFITLQMIAGTIDPADLDDARRVEWIAPAQAYLDPLKDAQATAESIDAGLTSRRRAVAAQGYDIETLDSEIAADKAREAKLGLSFNAPVPPLPGAPA